MLRAADLLTLDPSDLSRLRREISAEAEQMDEGGQQLVFQILDELVEGESSTTLAGLWDADYVRRPVAIGDFLDPYYIGEFANDIYPFWRDELEAVFAPDSQVSTWVITGAIGIGKCVHSKSLISGQGFRAIEEVTKGSWVQAEPGMRRVETTHVEGEIETRRLVTRHGHTLEGSPQHRVRVLDGLGVAWRRLDELQSGDAVLQVPAEDFGPVDLRPELAELMGWAVAEGCARRTITVLQLAEFELDYVEDLARAAGVGGVSRNDDLCRVSIISDREFVRAVGEGLRSWEKKVPECILQGSPGTIYAFLRGLFSGDGHSGKTDCSLTTVSPSLARQVRVLLTSLGMYCTVTSKVPTYTYRGEKRKGREAFTVRVVGAESLALFAAEIGFAQDYKQEQIEKRVAQEFNLNSSAVFGFHLTREAAEELREMQPRFWGSAPGKRTLPEGVTKATSPSRLLQRVVRGQRCTPRLLRQVVENGGELPEPLQMIADGRLLFDEVDRVEEGRAYCHDLTVEGDPSYISDTFISHNTAIGAVVLARMIYEISCLRNPQRFFGVGSGHRIIIGLFNVLKYKAQETAWDYLKSMIEAGPYWSEVFKRDPKKPAQLDFPEKRVTAITGASALHALGSNLFAVLIDEGNFYAPGEETSPDKSQALGRAFELHKAIQRRQRSRFMVGGKLPGVSVLASSKASKEDYVEEYRADHVDDPTVYVTDVPLWVAKGRNRFSKATFPVMVGNARISSRIIDDEERAAMPPEVDVVDVPEDFREDFETDPENALRDVAGVATYGIHLLLPVREKIDACATVKTYPIVRPVLEIGTEEEDEIIGYVDLETMFNVVGGHYQLRDYPTASRYIHVDLAARRDRAGFAMGCVSGMNWRTSRTAAGIETRSPAPMVYIDFALAITAPAGQEIDFDAILQFIFALRDFGVPLRGVTYDSWQSIHSIQALRKAKVRVETLSVDRDDVPYLLVRGLINEERLAYYPHPVLMQELRGLLRFPVKGRRQGEQRWKVDHPPKGCFVGETRVPLLDGTCPTIEELAERGTDEWFYSTDGEGRVVPGRGRARYTKDVGELVDVVLDSGFVARCTPDHLWRLRDGSYREAQHLRPGVDRLMPIKRQWPIDGGYERVVDKHGTRTLTHWMVEESVRGKVTSGYVVHHKNENKTDNRPENLEAVCPREHARDHTTAGHRDDPVYAEKVRAGLQRFNESEEGRQSHARALRRTTARMSSAELRARARSRPAFRSDITIEKLIRVRDDEPDVGNANAAARVLGCGRNVVIRVLADAGFSSWDEFAAGENHKVRFVIPVSCEPVPVYDIEVDAYENFSLSGEVVVHNSKDVSDAVAGVVFQCMNDEAERGQDSRASVPPLSVITPSRESQSAWLAADYDPETTDRDAWLKGGN